MGARGKKRKRSDGTVASGKSGSFARSEPPVEQVPTAALREIMPDILADYGSSDEEIEASNFYDDALMKAADKFSVNIDALEYRATRLGWLVENEGSSLVTRHADGAIEIDDRLLEYAATCDVRDAAAMVDWTRRLSSMLA